MSDEPEPCTVCRKNQPSAGWVCGACRLSIGEHLSRLSARLVDLPLHLAPSAAPPSERVATSRTGSPAPARLDVLSLLGHGAAVAGDHVFGDDQIGIVPPREWLGQQVDAWLAAFGHRQRPPAPVSPAGPPDERLSDDALAWMARHAPPALVVDAWMARTICDAYRTGRAQLVTGMAPGFNGRRPDTVREDDPLADEWAVRFGDPALARAPADNIRYLNTWLDQACESDELDMHRFTTELRSLNAELGRALGEKDDQAYLGRCPAPITDRKTETVSPCGAAIWQEPFASVVTCPRCRATHGPRVADLMRLARDIRRVWPLDRRKRYGLDEIDHVPDVPCPKCRQKVHVYWRDVTGTDDGWRTWFVPVGVMCPGGCAEALEVLR